MHLSPLRLPAQEKRLTLWLGVTSLFFGIFVKMTSELLENEVHGLDSSILTAVAKIRRPLLTSMAVDLTALGSITLVVLISAVALCILLSLGDRLILAVRYLPTTKARVLLLGLAVAVILLVCVSRVYLGVHYPSDVASGASLGIAWALLLAGSFSMIERHV